jgi:hypothetical protein
MMSIKRRIERLERQIPEIQPTPMKILGLHGAHPSQEEEEIGFREAREMNNEKHRILFFIPYDCKHGIISYRETILHEDSDLGIIIGEHCIYKLVEQYYSNSCYHDEDCPVITGEKTSTLGEKVF